MKRLMSFSVAAVVVALILHQGSPAQEADSRRDGFGGRGGMMDGPSNEFYFNPIGRKASPEDSEDRKLTSEDGALSGKIFELTRRLKGAATAEERADAEKQIAEAVAKQFEIRQALRESQLVELEQQLKRLRTIHAERANQRDRIVSDRVQQLLREADGLGWGDAGDAPGSLRSTSKRIWDLAPQKIVDRNGVDPASNLLDESFEPAKASR